MHVPVFVSNGHVRSGWRFAGFTVAMVLLLVGVRAALLAIPATAPLLQQAEAGTLTLEAALVLELVSLAVVLGVTVLAARMERRAPGTFGLPLESAFGRRFRQGVLWGLAMASLDIGVTWLLGGISFEASAMSAPRIALYGAGWAAAFTLVGLVEELMYRGYALVTLSAGIGFWPAAAVLAGAFGGLHLLNAGESVIGALNVVFYALFASFTLRRTGTLWFAVGIHAAWDYSLSFLYAVPNSGTLAEGQFLRAHMDGPTWLTGGAAGPEGSLIGFATLALAFVAFSRLFPASPRQPAAALAS